MAEVLPITRQNPCHAHLWLVAEGTGKPLFLVEFLERGRCIIKSNGHPFGSCRRGGISRRSSIGVIDFVHIRAYVWRLVTSGRASDVSCLETVSKARWTCRRVLALNERASRANISSYQCRRVSQRLEGRTSLTFSLQVSSHFSLQRGPLSSKLTHPVNMEGIYFVWRRRGMTTKAD